MTTKMLVNAIESEEYRIAVIKDGLLDGYYIETASNEQKIGNIYKGVIEHIEPGLQACFVNYGDEKNGFLPSNEIHPEYYSEGCEGFAGKSQPPIEKVMKKGQVLLVQVVKEMPGKKGAQLTTYLSLASRYLVLMPGSKGGISKKIEDDNERERIKSIVNQLKLPENIGCIVRTAALQEKKTELSKDLNRVLRVWNNIKKNVETAPNYSLLHKEQDICNRTLRDYFNNEITEILIDDRDVFNSVKSYMKIISPRHQGIIKFYKEKRPIFAHYEIEKQINAIYSNHVPLKSGGSIVIDTTEALIAIDVNSGRGNKGKDVEATAFKTNSEAAVEIVRQLRLRDIGGLVVVDFIDMKEKQHIRMIEKSMRDGTKDDRAKIDLSGISRFGLLELSRQRLRPSIESRSFQTCWHCKGKGLVPSVESAALSFLRQIWMGLAKKEFCQVNGVIPTDVASYLLNKKRKVIAQFESRYNVEIILTGDPLMPPGEGSLDFKELNVNGKN